MFAREGNYPFGRLNARKLSRNISRMCVEMDKLLRREFPYRKDSSDCAQHARSGSSLVARRNEISTSAKSLDEALKILEHSRAIRRKAEGFFQSLSLAQPNPPHSQQDVSFLSE